LFPERARHRAQLTYEFCPQATHALSKLLRQNETGCYCSQTIVVSEQNTVLTTPFAFLWTKHPQSSRVGFHAKLKRQRTAVTVTLDLPPQIEKAYLAEAQARGLSLDAVVREVLIAGHPKTVFEQGLGLFGSDEDAALLDEVVSIAYEERRRPVKPSVAL